jgi:hypothetical protein
MIQRVYIDTSVIGGCFDEEFEEWSNLLMEEIKAGAVSLRFYEDALHIASATIRKADILASCNFKHIVNIDRIRKYNAVNLMLGYSSIEIRTPREILKQNENEN